MGSRLFGFGQKWSPKHVWRCLFFIAVRRRLWLKEWEWVQINHFFVTFVWVCFVVCCVTNLICKAEENLIGSESRPSYCSGLRASVGTDSVPDPIQLHSKPWQHGTSSDLSCKVKAHCAAASISHYCGTEQMQNLDWNKCFQRVSDAGLHFPLCSPPLVGMYVCSLPSDHPGRPGRRVHQHSPPAAWCPWLKWMRAGVDIKQGVHRRFGHRKIHRRLRRDHFNCPRAQKNQATEEKSAERE